MKILRWVIIISLIFLAACENRSASEEVRPTKHFITNVNYDELYENFEQYIGDDVEFIGRVSYREYGLEQEAFQVWIDLENSSDPLVVTGDMEEEIVETGGFVKVYGTVMGGPVLRDGKIQNIIPPVIEVITMEAVSYQDALAPTLMSVDIGESIEQHGVLVQLDKIEFAEAETRLVLKVTNNTFDIISLWQYSALLEQEGKLFHVMLPQREAGYQKLDSTIIQQEISEGLIVFEPIDTEKKEVTFQLHVELNDLSITMDPFEFIISW